MKWIGNVSKREHNQYVRKKAELVDDVISKIQIISMIECVPGVSTGWVVSGFHPGQSQFKSWEIVKSY